MSGNHDHLPLTTAQTWVWLAQQADPENPIYKAAEYLDIRGRIDLSLLEAAVRRAVADTDAFLVRIEDDGESVRQVVDRSLDWPMPVTDLRDAEDPWAQAQAWMEADLHRTVDLGCAPLFTIAVLRLPADRSLLYISAHHLVMDGFGFSLFVRRATEVYTALEAGLECPPSTLGSLRRLVEDELHYQASERFARDREYWITQLSEPPDILSLAGRRAETCHTFLRETGQVPAPVADRLRGLARRARSSLPTVAMATLALYMHRMTGADDVILELTVTGRQGAVARNVPGMLSNAPPLRIPVRPEMSVGELVKHTATRARGLLQHQRYPSIYLPGDLGIVDIGEMPEPPAINIMGYDPALHFGRHPATLHNMSNGSVEDLTINVYERADDGSLRVDFNANPALYRAEDNVAHHRGFLDLLNALADAELEQPVEQVGLRPAGDTPDAEEPVRREVETAP